MSERLRIVVDRMNIQPDDEVLESGYGHGIAATMVCERLVTGHLLAIDRSRKIIEAATRRNMQHVKAGRAEFLRAELEHLELGERRFSKIFAVRVGLFWHEPERARAMAAKWLLTRGEIFVEYDQP